MDADREAQAYQHFTGKPMPGKFNGSGQTILREGTALREPIVALEIGELLSRQFPPMEEILSPWLRKQNLAMVYSKRGVGKTFFGLGVAYAVASGGSFLKWRAEKPRKVLFID